MVMVNSRQSGGSTGRRAEIKVRWYQHGGVWVIAVMIAMLIPPEIERGHNYNCENSYSSILRESDGGDGRSGSCRVSVMNPIS